jgi:hypothetical protein
MSPTLNWQVGTDGVTASAAIFYCGGRVAAPTTGVARRSGPDAGAKRKADKRTTVRSFRITPVPSSTPWDSPPKCCHKYEQQLASIPKR